MNPITDAQLIDFIYREAELIDALQLQDWEALLPTMATTGCRSRTARPIPSCRAR